MRNPETEKNEKYREAKSFGYPWSARLHTRCKRIKRCPSIKDDAQDIPNDAQRIKCDAQASRRCPSIKDHLCRKVNDSDHNPVTSHHKKQHTQTQKCLAPVKHRDKNGTPSSQSSTEQNRAQALKRVQNRTKVLNDSRKLLLHYAFHIEWRRCSSSARTS